MEKRGQISCENIMFDILFKTRREGRNAVMETARIKIKGMTCKGCEGTVKKALLTKSGVREVYINREEGTVSVTFDSTQTDVPALHQVILRKGYFPGPMEG